MFKVGDTVSYGKEGVCRISAVENRKFGTDVTEYYVLEALCKANSRIFIPTNNERLVAGLRKVLEKDDIEHLVIEINKGDPVWITDDSVRREEYKRILADADCLALGKCLRSIHYKKAELKARGKKLRRIDEDFFIQGQNILFNEFSYVLRISKDEVLTYILKA